MLLQDTFGEFDSTQRLKNLIHLICQLTGTYEVLLKAENGEEGIIHCSTGSVRNAACRNLSGIDALAVILTWSKGKYWLEELPVLPVRTINEPLEKAFSEAENLVEQLPSVPLHKETVFEIAPPLTKDEIPELKSTLPGPEVMKGKPDRKGENDAIDEKETPRGTEPHASTDILKEKKTAAAMGSGTREVARLAQKITAIDGVKGIIFASMDGSLLRTQDIDSGPQMAQLLALLGEALDQVGEAFGKDKLVHGSIEFADHRILIHTYMNIYVGTKIAFDSSASMIGSEVEKLLSEEP